jgi:hypothetical protein
MDIMDNSSVNYSSPWTRKHPRQLCGLNILKLRISRLNGSALWRSALRVRQNPRVKSARHDGGRVFSGAVVFSSYAVIRGS